MDEPIVFVCPQCGGTAYGGRLLLLSLLTQVICSRCDLDMVPQPVAPSGDKPDAPELPEPLVK